MLPGQPLPEAAMSVDSIPTVPARRRVLGLVLLAPALLLGCAPRRGPAFDPVPDDIAATVDMRLMAFDPEEVRVREGEAVLWRNLSAFTHTVTLDPARADVDLPAGAEGFDSGDIAPGEVFRHRFVEPGLYRYVCRPHADIGMAGRVVVVPIPAG
jgi:plastocyanin